MNDDPFEQRLRKVGQRRLPAEWRSEILSAARAAAAARPSRAEPEPSLTVWLRSWLWPHPTAWAALAVAWVLTFALDYSAAEQAGHRVVRQAPPSPQLRELLREQEQLFAELAGPAEPIRAVPPKPAATQPRSELRERLMRA